MPSTSSTLDARKAEVHQSSRRVNALKVIIMKGDTVVVPAPGLDRHEAPLTTRVPCARYALHAVELQFKRLEKRPRVARGNAGIGRSRLSCAPAAG